MYEETGGHHGIDYFQIMIMGLVVRNRIGTLDGSSMEG